MDKTYLEEVREELIDSMNSISVDLCDDYSIKDNYYISDIMSEYADSRVDVYTYDLLEWAKSNYEYVEEAIEEFGVSTESNRRPDFIKTIQSGQFLYYERQLYEDDKCISKLFAINYLYNNPDDLNFNLTDEQIEEMLSEIETQIDTDNYISDILEIVNEYIKIEDK